jgi:hypothetical protein
MMKLMKKDLKLMVKLMKKDLKLMVKLMNPSIYNCMDLNI